MRTRAQNVSPIVFSSVPVVSLLAFSVLAGSLLSGGVAKAAGTSSSSTTKVTAPPLPPPVAPIPLAQESGITGARALSIAEALQLGEKQNRDLQGARERLSGSKADIERAMAALLPTVTAQGKLTVNIPEVRLNLDQSGSVFGSAVQGAQLADLNTKVNGSPVATGPITKVLLDTVCNDPNRVNPPGVAASCMQFQNPGQTMQDLGKVLESANINVAIQPQVQVDAVIAANIPLLVPAAYPALSGAKLAYKSQEKQLVVTTAQVLQSVASSFYTAAGTEEVVSARVHAIEVAQKTADNARIRLAAGVVNRVEVTRAELALIQAQQRLLEAQDQRAAAYRTLARLLKLEAGSFKVVPPPEPSLEPGTSDQLVGDALQRRPELASLDLAVQATSAQISSSWLRWSPTLSAFGNIRLTNATGFAGRIDYYAVGAQLDWLIFDGFARDATRHQAEAQRRDSLLRLEQLRDSISDEVINARRSVLTRKQGLVAAQRSVSMAKETLDLVRVQYEAGTATQLDLLTAQDQLVLAEVGLAQARFDMSLSVINLRRVSGSPLIEGGGA
ncbi:MAG: TolC family protein [Deltaproteobacteria bacterium]|jgi:outer membrane protein TolC|nr:TolC family protein [Deltaproteobacteria bacterium]